MGDLAIDVLYKGLCSLDSPLYQPSLYGRHVIRKLELGDINETEWWWTSEQAMNGNGEINCTMLGNRNRLEFQITVTLGAISFTLYSIGSTVVDPTTFEPVTSYYVKVSQNN